MSVRSKIFALATAAMGVALAVASSAQAFGNINAW